MKFDILTLFPEMFLGPMTESILRRAQERELIDVRLHNIRDYATDRHKTVDDAPYGGGAGMVMKVEPLTACLEAVLADCPGTRIILTSPTGRQLTQVIVAELAAEVGLVIICGRYEGIDERVRELFQLDEISLGDFVLTGGELAAMTLVDAVSRLVPGVLGSDESAQTDSFSDGLLEYPHYTRPPEFRGHGVPDALLSGNHAGIARWRRQQSLRTTLARRPDLLPDAPLDREDIRYLEQLASEAKQ
jgi:tRNA (guanine37-N1)-methyltransferase